MISLHLAVLIHPCQQWLNLRFSTHRPVLHSASWIYSVLPVGWAPGTPSWHKVHTCNRKHHRRWIRYSKQLQKLTSNCWFSSSMSVAFMSRKVPSLLFLTCAGWRPLSALVSGWPGCDGDAVDNQSSYTPSAPYSPLSLRTGSWGLGGRSGEGPRCRVCRHYPGCLWSQCQSTAPLGCYCGQAPGDVAFLVVHSFYLKAPETWKHFQKIKVCLITCLYLIT